MPWLGGDVIEYPDVGGNGPSLEDRIFNSIADICAKLDARHAELRELQARVKASAITCVALEKRIVELEIKFNNHSHHTGNE
jgi:hypothetical protein